MKRVTIFVLALALVTFVPAFAQTHNTQSNPQADTRGERNLPDQVDIVGTPDVRTSSNSATIRWQTNNVAATDVWLEGGGIRGHRTEYQRGGRRDHQVTFSNLKPNTTYTFLIRSGKGEVRYQGNFTTR
ncbi:MAG TPA: fibronectin type III domain-containing protein [Terriglobales bacterium]|nr:fibronectin type III domain-containing protein [Terriglobales bacterium]